jgi:soluble lytic murein transglycosylase-like protein
MTALAYVLSLVVGSAEISDVPPMLLVSLIAHESRFNSRAVGASGEIGLAQHHPNGWHRMYCRGFDLYDPAENVLCASLVLRRFFVRCRTWEGALSRYNGRPDCKPSRYSRRILAMVER